MHWHHTPWSYFMSTVKISQAWNNRLSQLQYQQVIQLPLPPSPPSYTFLQTHCPDSRPTDFEYPDSLLKNHREISKNKDNKRRKKEKVTTKSANHGARPIFVLPTTVANKLTFLFGFSWSSQHKKVSSHSNIEEKKHNKMKPNQPIHEKIFLWQDKN